MLFQRRIYIARGEMLWDLHYFGDLHLVWGFTFTLHLRRIYITLGIFATSFLPNIGEDQKKSYHLSAGPWHFVVW